MKHSNVIDFYKAVYRLSDENRFKRLEHIERIVNWYHVRYETNSTKLIVNE